jgi:hypothetical protein
MSVQTKSSILYCISVPFFGGFLGAIGVAFVEYLVALVGLTSQFNLSLQWIQNFSWGGAMWGFIPSIFLLLRRGNVYLISLLTMIIAVTYGLFVLQGVPLIFTLEIIVVYLINSVYALIMALTIINAHVLEEYKFVFQNLLPKPVKITQPPKQYFKCPNCDKGFEKYKDLSKHLHEHR